MIIDASGVTEKPSIQHYLHDYTYPQIPESVDHIIDWAGVLWAGPHRKNLNAPNPVDLWRAWQKSVQRAKDVPQTVMDYFQATKHFTRPPKKGEGIEIMESLKKAGASMGLVEAVQEAVKQTQPRFTWSPSKIMQFDTCPYQFAAQYYYKTLPYQETEATIWGHRVHKQAENFMNGVEIDDIEAFKPVEKWVKTLSKIDGERFVEHKMGVSDKLIAMDYDSAEGRMILDLGIKRGDELILIDWKTGKKKDDHIQMKIYALIMAIQHPEVQKITYKYVWLKTGEATGATITRAELAPIAKNVLSKIKAMKSAWSSENFPKQKNGLCRNWCAVSECPHSGGKR